MTLLVEDQEDACHQALVARPRRPGYAGQEGKNPPTGRNEPKKGLEALDALVF